MTNTCESVTGIHRPSLSAWRKWLTSDAAAVMGLCSPVPTACQRCYLGASTVLAFLPSESITTIAIDIIPHVFQQVDGSNSTSLETKIHSDFAYSSNESNYGSTVGDGNPLTWKLHGVELTYPTTYAFITPVLGAGMTSNVSATPACAEARHLTELDTPVTADAMSLFLPLGPQFHINNEPVVSIPSPILSYLGSFQRAWPGFADLQLSSCLQFNAGFALPRSITGGIANAPCYLTAPGVVATSCTTSLNSTKCFTTTTYGIETLPAPTLSEPAGPPQTPITLATASILSRRTGAEQFTPAQVPVGILPTANDHTPSPESATRLGTSVAEQEGVIPANTQHTTANAATGSQDSTPDPVSDVDDSPAAATPRSGEHTVPGGSPIIGDDGSANQASAAVSSTHSDAVGSYIMNGLQPGTTQGNAPSGSGRSGSRAITLGNSIVTSNAHGEFGLPGGSALTDGGTAIVDGTTISLAPAAFVAVINGVIKTLENAGPSQGRNGAITVGGTVINGVSETLRNTGSSRAGNGAITVGGAAITPNAQGVYDLWEGATLTPGGTAFADGTTFSLDAAGSAVVINGVTQDLTFPAQTTRGSEASNAIRIGGAVVTPNARHQFILPGGVTLSPKGIAIVNGTTVSLDAEGSVAIVNGVTQTLTAPSQPIAGSGATTTAEQTGSGPSASYSASVMVQTGEAGRKSLGTRTHGLSAALVIAFVISMQLNA